MGVLCNTKRAPKSPLGNHSGRDSEIGSLNSDTYISYTVWSVVVPYTHISPGPLRVSPIRSRSRNFVRGIYQMFSNPDTIRVERCAANAQIRSVLRVLMIVVALVALGAPLMAQEAGGEANLRLPDLGSDVSRWYYRKQSPDGWSRCQRLRPHLRSHHLYSPSQHAGSRLHARSQRTDLRDLQDLSRHPGKIPLHSGRLHRDYRFLLRLPAANGGLSGCIILLFSVVGIAGSFWSRPSECASTPSPIRAPRSPRSRANPIRATTFRCRPA